MRYEFLFLQRTVDNCTKVLVIRGIWRTFSQKDSTDCINPDEFTIYSSGSLKEKAKFKS